MDNNTRSNKDQGSSDKDESGVLGPGENEVTAGQAGLRGRRVESGRGEGTEHQLKYLEEARRIVLTFDEIKEYAVFVFGSRADGSAHQRSDIDIGILGKQALAVVIKLNIEEKLEESNIPLRVDLIDFFKADPVFKREALKNTVIWNLPKDIELV